MNISGLDCGERAFSISWSDQSVTHYPFIWLRDNDPGELHPDTKERVFDLTGVDLKVQPQVFELTQSALIIRWPQRSEPSVYPVEWLFAHQPGQIRADPAVVKRVLWDRHSLVDVPRVDASSCLNSPQAMIDALLTVKRCGILIFENLADHIDAGVLFGERIGFKRETNFGVLFDVLSKSAPNNLAYTSLALQLHTDLPNQQFIPGFQFLHSFRNSANGGESIFADGFRICTDLAEHQPAMFELLSQVQLPWRFHDNGCDVRYHRAMINLQADGNFDSFVFNTHIADIPDLDSPQLYDFYAAYQELMNCLRNPKYAITLRLAAGEMVVFDNRRVVHGRTAFDPASGERHYRGYYIEQNEIDSCIRVLSRAS